MTQEQSMTTESALKAIKHIQKVFYVVGAINVFFTIPGLMIIGFNFISVLLVINFLLALIIIFMGWSLNKSYRQVIPKAALVLSVLLLFLAIIEHILMKDISIAGFIFPIALWIIGKQSQRAITVLENSKK